MVISNGHHKGMVDNQANFSPVSGLTVGTIIAICVGAILAVIGAAAFAYQMVRRRSDSRSKHKLASALRKGLLNEEAVPRNMPRSLSQFSRFSNSSRDSAGRSPSTPDVLHMESELFQGKVRESHDASDDCGDGAEQDKNVNLGKLGYSINYEAGKQTLIITIKKAVDLPAKDTQMGTSDPYVKLQLLPEKRHKVKTRVLRKTLNPVYEESFTFYGISATQLKATSLHFVVLSFDRFSRDDIIGEVLCPLKDLDLENFDNVMQMSDIQPRQFKIKNQSRGELLVSMCYQPAASRLTSVILKARNLPKMDVTGLAGDPYVKLYLLYNGQRIAKKKTHVKKRTLNPVYNESFIFEVPANESLENLSIEFLLLDWDRVTKNEIIGRLELGLGKGDLADKHWQEVINCPRKQIAEWHKLHE